MYIYDVQINFNIYVILFGSVIVLGIFAAVCLFLRKHNQRPNRILAAFLLAISLWLIDVFMRVSGLYNQNADLYFKPIYYSFAFGPLLYFYVKSIVNSELVFTRKDLLHFLPVSIQACLYIFLSFQSYEYRLWYWQDVHLPWTYRLEFDGTFISLAIYLFFSLRILGGYKKWLTDSFSDISKIHLQWLRIILLLMLILSAQWFVEVILRDLYDNFYQHNYSSMILGFLTLVLAYKAFYQDDQGGIKYEQIKEAPSSSVEDTFDPDVLGKIVSRMAEEKDYLDPTLNLRSFAANCDIPQRTVSRYINQHIGKTFHQFVNEYRVEEFKQKAISKEEQGMTLEGIAYDCGFNSKASFNRVFKSISGLTPTQYVSKHVSKGA